MGYWSFETVFCHTSQILSRFCGRIAPRPRPTIAPKSTPKKGRETFGHLPTSDKFNPSLLNQRIHHLSKSDVVADTIAEECKPIRHKPAQGPFLLGNTAKQRENTGDYAWVKLAWRSGIWRGARWYVARTQTEERERTPSANGRAVAFVEQSRSLDGERTRARGAPRRRTRCENRAGGTRKRAPSALHSRHLNCNTERRDAREGSYASEALTARGRQCFERMNGGIIGGLGLVCQVKSFGDAVKCR